VRLSLTAQVLRHQCASGHRRQKPNRGDHDGSNHDSGGSDFFFPAHLSGVGKLLTFGEHVRRGDLFEQLCSQEQNCEVVQKSDEWDEARNELNWTQQIAESTNRQQPRVPTRARMFKHKVENMRFFLEPLRLLLPAHGSRLRTHVFGLGFGLRPGQGRAGHTCQLGGAVTSPGKASGMFAASQLANLTAGKRGYLKTILTRNFTNSGSEKMVSSKGRRGAAVVAAKRAMSTSPKGTMRISRTFE
jgi:hypothetical protein